MGRPAEQPCGPSYWQWPPWQGGGSRGCPETCLPPGRGGVGGGRCQSPIATKASSQEVPAKPSWVLTESRALDHFLHLTTLQPVSRLHPKETRQRRRASLTGPHTQARASTSSTEPRPLTPLQEQRETRHSLPSWHPSLCTCPCIDSLLGMGGDLPWVLLANGTVGRQFLTAGPSWCSRITRHKFQAHSGHTGDACQESGLLPAGLGLARSRPNSSPSLLPFLTLEFLHRVKLQDPGSCLARPARRSLSITYTAGCREGPLGPRHSLTWRLWPWRPQSVLRRSGGGVCPELVLGFWGLSGFP